MSDFKRFFNHKSSDSHEIVVTPTVSKQRLQNGETFTIKQDNIKVVENSNKEEWKITIKISREKEAEDDMR